MARLIEVAESPVRWAIPVFCVAEFMRVMTHPRLFDSPYSAAEACAAVSRILASPSVTLLRPGPDYPEILFEAVREANAVGNLVFDAQIVALCREHGVGRLLTEDRDFERFAGLRTEQLEA